MIQQLRFSPRRQVACGVMAAIFCAVLLVSEARAADPIATFNTSAGTFQVELFPTQAPDTVANFLSYVDSGEYNNLIVQRIVAGFIAQTGGYTTDGAPFTPSIQPSHISTAPTDGGQGFKLPNEFGLSNVTGTLAMAKLASDPNSATSEFFFNLANNATNLDNQNGGFTVFGQVIGNGMSVLSTMAATPNFDISSVWGGAFQNLPLSNWNIQTATEIDANNFVTISTITVPRVTGDVNFDGIVNGQDIALVSSSWLTTGINLTDVNHDHIVNGQDIALMSSNWLHALPAEGSALAVPEPTSALLLIAGAASASLWRRRVAARASHR